MKSGRRFGLVFVLLDLSRFGFVGVMLHFGKLRFFIHGSGESLVPGFKKGIYVLLFLSFLNWNFSLIMGF